MTRPTRPDVTEFFNLNDHPKMKSTFKIVPEMFDKTPDGFKLDPPYPGCIVTIIDHIADKSVSIRLDGEYTCTSIGDFIRSCGEMPVVEVEEKV